MKQKPSIVFVHGGHSWYLRYTVNQAMSACPTSPVVVLTDAELGEGVTTSLLARHRSSPRAREFQAKYVHMHSGNRDWELFCFLRWFCLLDYMEESNTESVLYLDSDVLLYSSVDDILRSYSASNIRYALSVPRQELESYQWHASGHSSFWTIRALREFCEFATRSFTEEERLAMYRQKWSWNQRTGERGGVSDMTALYLFWLQSKDGAANFAEESNGSVVDHNINIAHNYEEDEYEMVGDRKRVDFVEDRPMLVKRSNGERVLAHALHLQGGAKNSIPIYYRGARFPGRSGGDLYAFMRRIGQRGKRLVGR